MTSETAHFTPPRAIAAEGARVGVVSCLRCGAAILIDPADEEGTLGLHEHWHASVESRLQAASESGLSR